MHRQYHYKIPERTLQSFHRKEPDSVWNPVYKYKDEYSAHQAANFIHRDAVDIALDGLLERGSRRGKLYRFLRTIAAQQRVNQAGAEGIAAAQAIHQTNGVFLRYHHLAAHTVVEHAGPVVIGSR